MARLWKKEQGNSPRTPTEKKSDLVVLPAGKWRTEERVVELR